jgi:hypothetical protein
VTRLAYFLLHSHFISQHIFEAPQGGSRGGG